MKRALPVALLCAGAAALPATASADTTSHALARAAGAGSLSALDEEWMTTDMQGDMFEIRGGKIAERNSTNRAVLKLARTLVHDHSQSLKEAEAMARDFGIEIPKSPTMSMTWELNTVKMMRGAAFDRAYSSLEGNDHIQDISEATDEVEDGYNAQVREMAKEELPMLRRHEKLSQQAYKASR